MIAWIVKPIRCFFLLLMISILFSGCSLVGESVKSVENISNYAELLFKRQNFLTQQVMMLLEDDIAEVEDEKIYQAEDQMHEACHLLNEYANREIDGKGTSIFFRRLLQRSFDKCEEKVIQMDLILKDIDENLPPI